MNTAKILSSANIPLYPLSFKVVILSLKIPITIKFLTTPPQVRTSCLLPLPLPPTSLLSTHILPPPYLPVPNFAPIYPIPPPPTCITTTPTSCTCALGYHQTYDVLAKEVMFFIILTIFRTDGGCWYDSITDQIKLYNIPNLPRDHVALRQTVLDAIPSLPQVKHSHLT